MSCYGKTLLQVALTPIRNIVEKSQHPPASSIHPVQYLSQRKVRDSSVTPRPQFHADTLRQSMLGKGLARSRSEAREDAFGVSKDREASGGFGSLRAPKPLNTIIYMPRLGLPGRAFSEEIDKSLSLRSRNDGAAGRSQSERLGCWKL